MVMNKVNHAMKRWWTAVMVAVAATAAATVYPPYDFYPYLADSTDNPPLNYTKVCEPGRTGEANASYVALGIWFPRAYPALANTGYSGNLTIPAYIDSLPVRKIKEAGFLTCQSLKSVRIPSTMREIDARAFCWCTSLTNVIFEEGVQSIGAFTFSNCYNLVSVTFPASLSHLGEGCFEKCDSLRHVYFRGNAPLVDRPGDPAKSCLGEPWYNAGGPYERLKVHINKNTYGWIAPYQKGVPEKWPVDFGYMQAHETVAEDGSGSSDIASDEQGVPYALSSKAADRTVASLTVDSDYSLGSFVMKGGKVYDSVLYISNTAGREVKLKLPSGNTYKTFKGATPLVIPANSTSILTITRVAGGSSGGNVFLVSREELESVK